MFVNNVDFLDITNRYYIIKFDCQNKLSFVIQPRFINIEDRITTYIYIKQKW